MIALAMTELYTLATGIGVINIFILMLLIYTYWETYNKIKSSFTIGLIIFSMLMLFQNVVSVAFVLLPNSNIENVLDVQLSFTELPLTLINTIQLLALMILFNLSKN